MSHRLASALSLGWSLGIILWVAAAAATQTPMGLTGLAMALMCFCGGPCVAQAVRTSA